MKYILLLKVFMSLVLADDMKVDLLRLENDIPQIGEEAERGITYTSNGVTVSASRLCRWSSKLRPKNQKEDELLMSYMASKNPFLRFICANAILESRGVNWLLDEKIRLNDSFQEVDSVKFSKLMGNLTLILKRERIFDPSKK